MRSVLMRRTAVAGCLGAAAVALMALITVQHGETQAAGLGPSEAAALAVKYAQLGTLGEGRLMSAPSAINAQQTTLGAASLLLHGRPIDPVTKLAQEQARAVWIVFIRGDIRVSIDAPSPLAAAPASGAIRSSYTYRQMGLVLDATTGEKLHFGIYPVGREVAGAADLPAVTLSERSQDVRLPVLTKPTEAPLPTLTPPGQPGLAERPQRTPVPPSPSRATATPAR